MAISIWKDYGGHRDSGSTSLVAILATLIPTSVTAIIFLAIFVAIRTRYKKIYLPRVFLGTVPEKDRTPSSNRTGTKWFHDFRKLNDRFVLQHQSLDGYLYLRFFKFIITICLVGSCITWPILFPVNATGGGDASQLDIISFSNISGSKRLYAHAVVAWLFLGFVLLWTTRERLFLIGARQAFLLSKQNATRLSSKVILFLNVPDSVLNEENLHKTFGKNAERSWKVSNLSELESLVEDRNDKASKLEAAEIEISQNATKKKLHHNQKDSANGAQEIEDGGNIDTTGVTRPTHKLTPVVGKKVDAIAYLREKLLDLAKKVNELRDNKTHSTEAHSGAIFVAYKNQAAAQKSYREISFHPLVPNKTKFIGVQPKEIIWKNLTLSTSTRVSQASLATAFIVATIIFWSIPIGIVGTISNITYLTNKVKFLRFINNLPPSILGLITGLLPPYLMSSFVSYVPKFMRYIAKLSGEPTLPEAELKTQAWYFTFQVIQVFLVTTFSSGAAAVATQITREPGMIPNLLAENLPKASNFYLTYFILQGIASAAKNVLNYSDLFEYLFYEKFLWKTPRDKYNGFIRMKGLSWGSVYPKFVNMAVIAIAYSCIAPLVLGFATVGLYLYYLSYRYNLLYVIQTKVDSKGDCYARALQSLMTGVYLSEICLIGLFSARDAPGPSILLVILLLITIIYHAMLDRLLAPLELFVPMDPTDSEEETPLLAAEEGIAADAEANEDDNSTRPQGHHFGLPTLPLFLAAPLATFISPYIASARHTVSSSLHDPSARGDDEGPTYTDEEIENAYKNPALTSKTPKLWLVRDEVGLSKEEMEANEKVGLKCSDEGAWFGRKGEVQFEMEDLGRVPLFKMPVRY